MPEADSINVALAVGFSRRLPEYKIWQAMKNRCLNPECNMFKYYGARGIGVFEPWQHDFEAFIRYIGLRPDKSLTLDRLDNSKGYEPGNVAWKSRGHQVRNRRNNWNVTLDGVTHCVTDWALILGISIATIYRRKATGITDPGRLLAPILEAKCCVYCGNSFTPTGTAQIICGARECYNKRQADYKRQRAEVRAA